MEIGLIIFVLVVISVGTTCFASGKQVGKKRTIKEIGKRLRLMEGAISAEKLVGILEEVKKEKF